MSARPDDENPRPRRRYDSPVRREQAARTRERILAAGSELAHGVATWDWQSLTFRAVAERAGVGERTVYRYFRTERELHDAVMRRLQEEAGVAYEGLELGDLAEVTGRSFSTLSSFAVSNWSGDMPEQPALVDEDLRRRDALAAAVLRHTADWPDERRRMVAGIFDVLWHVPSYERLRAAWDLDGRQASEALGWAIDVLADAVRSGRAPAG